MINRTRRKTLALIGAGTGLAVSVPLRAVTLSADNASCLTDATAAGGDLVSIVNCAEQIALTIESGSRAGLVGMPRRAKLTLRNLTDTTVIVKHIQPGLVHLGEASYDLNSILQKSSIGIGAGLARTFELTATRHDQRERPLSTSSKHKRISVAQLTGSHPSGQILDSSRIIFS